MAVDPVVCADAWFIMGQASTGVAANPAARAKAKVVFLIALLLVYHLPRTNHEPGSPAGQ
jgi:hypothetical protein